MLTGIPSVLQQLGGGEGGVSGGTDGGGEGYTPQTRSLASPPSWHSETT